MATERLASKPNTVQFNADVNYTSKRDFDIKLVQMREEGHTRNFVVNHFLQYYASHGLPRLEG